MTTSRLGADIAAELETFTSGWLPIASQSAGASYALPGSASGCDLLEQSGSPAVFPG